MHWRGPGIIRTIGSVLLPDGVDEMYQTPGHRSGSDTRMLTLAPFSFVIGFQLRIEAAS